jgi:nicotinamidase/pyrazinamidase
VVATQDWHPADHKSFASAHPRKKVFDEINLDGLPQVLWPDHCVQESYGAQFSSLLHKKKIEAIFRKGMDKNIDSYSGFFDNGKKKATGMGDYLKGRGVTEISVCGLAADYCVYFTALDGMELGFESTIIPNATKAIHPENFEKLLQDFHAKEKQNRISF